MPETTARTSSTFSVPRAKVALLLGILVAGVGNSFVFAVLPPIGREMVFTELPVGSLFTASALVFMMGAPLWGAAAEAWGRKPVIALVAWRTRSIGWTLLIGMVSIWVLEAVS